MRQKANLRVQLFELLLKLPDIDTSKDRPAFFVRYIGLEPRLRYLINWEGSSQTFINDLLTRVAREGREHFLRFLQSLDTDIWGTEQRAEIRSLAYAIRRLTEPQWEQEFVTSRYYASLEEGALALKRKEYHQARSLLKDAIQEIASSEKRPAAKARYLLALATLGEELPCQKGVVVREKIDELMNAAIMLDRCKAYLFAFASIKRDIFESNPSYERRQEAYNITKQANAEPGTDYDAELLSYLETCQPDLYYQA